MHLHHRLRWQWNPPFKHDDTLQTCVQYSLSSGWDSNSVDFATWGLTDNDRKLQAFLSYNEDEVGSAQTVAQKPFDVQPVLGQKIGHFPRRRSGMGSFADTLANQFVFIILFNRLLHFIIDPLGGSSAISC